MLTNQIRIIVKSVNDILNEEIKYETNEIFTKITIGSESHKTTNKTLEPHQTSVQWNEELRFTIDPLFTIKMYVELYNFNKYGLDASLGNTEIELKQPFTQNLILSLKPKGTIMIDLISMFPLQNNFGMFNTHQFGMNSNLSLFQQNEMNQYNQFNQFQQINQLNQNKENNTTTDNEPIFYTINQNENNEKEKEKIKEEKDIPIILNKRNDNDDKSSKEIKLTKDLKEMKDNENSKRKKVTKENKSNSETEDSMTEISDLDNMKNINNINVNIIEKEKENENQVQKVQSESFNPNIIGKNLNLNTTVLQRNCKPFSIQQQQIGTNETYFINCSYYGLQNNIYIPYANGHAFVPF